MANQFLTDEHTQVLQKLVQEVVNDPSTYMGSKYLPAVTLPTRKIFVDVIEATGGVTNEHVPGTDPEYIQAFGTRTQEFDAPFYREGIHYGEEKILFLRELGQNDRSKRGIRQYIDKAVDQLNRRLEARIELLRWQAIINGGFSYLNQTVSFGVPSGNRAVPVGALWSLNGISANNSADPLVDIRYWLGGGLAGFRKYKVSKMVMNPNTARWILDNTNVRSFITSYGANPQFNNFELNKVLQFVIPGAPEAVIYDGWYQTESVDSSNKITVSDAVYFLPDGYIFFEVSNLPGGDKIGEFVECINLQSGSLDAPGVGKFLIVEDNIPAGTRGGPRNPYMDLWAGVNGGPKLDRPFDVLTAKVIA